MRAEHQITLEIGDDRFLIIADEESTLEAVSPAVRQWQIDGAALPGFKLEAPTEEAGLWVLLGANGAVLARARQLEPLLGVLEHHLQALATPRLHHRLSLAALAGPDGAVLIDFTLWKQQPPVERQLKRMGLAVIDSPFIQLSDELRLVPPQHPIAKSSVPGHLNLHEASLPIKGLLWTGFAGAVPVSPGQVAHALASSLVTGRPAEKLDTAIEMAGRMDARLIDPFERNAVAHMAQTMVARPD